MVDERTFLNDVLLGNQDAVNFCISLGELTQTIDDVIDMDKPLTKGDVIHAFLSALVTIPLNPFYRDNLAVFGSILTTVFADYQASVEMETYSHHDKTLAFVLRDNLISVAIMCAVIVGGVRYGMEKATAIRQYFHDETLEDYIGGLE